LRRDLPVGGRIPGSLIDPVEHSNQPFGQPDEDLVKPESSSGRSKLFRLSGAHGGHEIGKGQPSLEEVHLPIPFQLPPVVQLPGEPDLGHHVGREVSLVAGIVDRKHTGDVPAKPVGQSGPEENQGERGVPIMCVQQNRTGNEPREGGDGSKSKECEAAGIVGIVDGVLAIDARPVEVIQMLDEEDLGARAGPGHAKDPRLLVVSPHRDHERLPNGLEIGIHIADSAIEREYGGHVETGGALKAGQTAHRLGHPAGTSVGIVLRRHVHDGNRLTSRGSEGCGRCGRIACWLVERRHPLDLTPWVDRRLTPPPGLPVRSTPARIPASSASP
jgi:hypothetical protein